MSQIMTRMSPKYKQMAFETAIRNPERYKEILSAVLQFEGKVLDDKTILTIISSLYLNKVVSGGGLVINENDTIDSIKNDVIRINATRKRDGGFPKGYPSRFWTYMRTLSEFGFVYARYGKKFLISDVAKKLINGTIDEQEAFSIQAMKYNRQSPYRNVLNDFNYFRFILKVLIELNKKGKKLSYWQFVVSTFSKDGNVKEFLDLIENNVFNDKISTYEFLKNKYENLASMDTVVKDYPDVILRLLRITGFVSVEYRGIVMIGLNTNCEEYINNLLKYEFALNEKEKEEDFSHYEKLSNLSDEEFEIIKSNREESNVIKNYNEVINQIISSYELDLKSIVEKIKEVCSSSGCSDNRFRYIPDPLKFEFFIAIFIHLVYGSEMIVKPNYKVDSNGMPISHAPGNVGDIEVYNNDLYWLIEVTLIRNKAQQLNNETINLFRHISDREIDVKYLSLVAPTIHEDTEDIYNVATINQLVKKGYLNNFYSKPYKVDDFIHCSMDKSIFDNMEEHTINLIKTFQEQLKKALGFIDLE